MTAETKHPTVERFQPPDGNMKIWRYLGLPQLIDFLETRSLHFARADTLDDPYEGTWPELNIAGRALPLPNPEDYQLEQGYITRFTRQTMYINCWCGGETESVAMWELYGTAVGSIAIQSTYKKLLEALPDTTYLGMVQYQDYSSLEDVIPSENVMDPFMHKRKEHEHEKEVRAFNWILGGRTREGPINLDELPEGIKVDIDIDKVVETIRVRLKTPTWVKGAIENLLKKYAWDMKVISSRIDSEPMY